MGDVTRMGAERSSHPIPVGLEHVLALAAAHPEFWAALRRDPRAALIAASLELTPTEQAILAAAPDSSLEQMIQQVDAGLSQPERRRFLERASVAVALLLGGNALLGCDKDTNEYGKPSAPAQSNPPVRPRPPARPSRPVQVKSNRPLPPGHGSMGARPDREPPAMRDARSEELQRLLRRAGTRPEKPDATAEDGKKRPRPTRNASSRRRRRSTQNRPASMGIRPSRFRSP